MLEAHDLSDRDIQWTRIVELDPDRRKPSSFHLPLTMRTDVMSFNEIFEQLSLLKLVIFRPRQVCRKFRFLPACGN